MLDTFYFMFNRHITAKSFRKWLKRYVSLFRIDNKEYFRKGQISLVIFLWIFIAVIFYYLFRFVQVLMKMRQDPLLPATAEEMKALRIEPQRPMKSFTYASQKSGIIFYSLFSVYIISMFIVIWNLRQELIVPLYFLILYPVFFTTNLLNVFAFTKDGIISRTRFIAWKRIKSYEFRRIDINHSYYGHSKEVNDQLELRLETRFWTYKCIVMTEEMENKVIDLLETYGIEEKVKEKLVSEK